MDIKDMPYTTVATEFHTLPRLRSMHPSHSTLRRMSQPVPLLRTVEHAFAAGWISLAELTVWGQIPLPDESEQEPWDRSCAHRSTMATLSARASSLAISQS